MSIQTRASGPAPSRPPVSPSRAVKSTSSARAKANAMTKEPISVSVAHTHTHTHTHTPKVVCWLARFPRIRERRAIQAGLGATYSGLLDRVKLHHSHAVLAHEHLHLKCQVKPSSECECEHLCGASACMCTCVRVCVLCLFHTSACARLGTLIGLP